MTRTGKRPSPSRARDRARHEEEILAAAERLFARKGYTAATMVEVAAEAGFAIATLYNLFGSKDAIHEALLERHLDALLAEVEAAVGEARTPREKLEANVAARARYLGEHRDFFRLYASAVPGGAVAFMGLAVAYAISARRVDWIAVIAGPLFIVGVLFLLSGARAPAPRA
jgi:TetR/AcrR family transcriptional regulator